MKKIIATGVCAVLFVGGINAQTIYDGVNFTSKDLNGTARFVGMGGAMGALGGDISTIGTNPAGIGIYRSNDVMTSFSFSANGKESKYAGKSINNDNNNWSYDNIGFVFAAKIGNETPLRYVNFGFNYHKAKSFYSNMSMNGQLNLTPDGGVVSQSYQMANQANRMFDEGRVDIQTLYDDNKNLFADPNVGWLAALGYQGFVYEKFDNGQYDIINARPDAEFYSQERGGIDQYDFNIAFNFNDRVYLGATVGVYDVNYNKFSRYAENFGDSQDYFLESTNKINGAGYDFKLGMIVRPFESSPLRFGVAIHTPTFYKLTLTTQAYLNSQFWFDNEDGTETSVETEVDTYWEMDDRDVSREFRLRTPWKYNFSLGYTVGRNLALGAEYEYQDYSSMSFGYPEGDEMLAENETTSMLKGVNTFRVGAEYKVIPQFALRLGYNLSSAFYTNDAFKNLPANSINTDTDYNNSKAISNYTLGIGYRGSLLYADLAYQFTTYKSDFYAFHDPDGFLDKTKVSNTRSQVLVTLGMRF